MRWPGFRSWSPVRREQIGTMVLRGALAVVAASKGFCQLAEAVLELDPDTVRDVLRRKFGEDNLAEPGREPERPTTWDLKSESLTAARLRLSSVTLFCFNTCTHRLANMTSDRNN